MCLQLRGDIVRLLLVSRRLLVECGFYCCMHVTLNFLMKIKSVYHFKMCWFHFCTLIHDSNHHLTILMISKARHKTAVTPLVMHCSLALKPWLYWCPWLNERTSCSKLLSCSWQINSKSCTRNSHKIPHNKLMRKVWGNAMKSYQCEFS